MKSRKFRLAVGLGIFCILLLAGATVIVLPVLLVFMFFQRHFIEGIATSGIK